MPLQEQCEFLSIPLEQIEAPYDVSMRVWAHGVLVSRNPECIVAEIFREQGWEVAWCEGGPILLMMKSLSFRWFADNHEMGIEDARSRYFEALCTIHGAHELEIRDHLRTCKKEQYLEHFDYIYGTPFIEAMYPFVSRNLMSLLYDNFLDTACRIFDIFMKDPYKYRAGWPDVIVVSSDMVRFYEVKTSDRLHENQKRIIEDFRDVCGLDIRVLRLKPTLPN